jgi:hypothetical protein
MAELSLQIEAIAALNDRLRQTGQGGRVVCTPGFADLDQDVQAEIITRIQQYNDFDADPWNERDAGQVEYDGLKVFWKIDYHNANTYKNPEMEGLSIDPGLEDATDRIMTIMLLDEY